MIELSDTQKGVFKGMVSALFLSMLIIGLAIYLDPLSYSGINTVAARAEVLGVALILPTFCLIACIGRLAKFRFFSPEDIDGSALSKGTETAVVLQSLLQNTLEQLMLVFGIYTAWCLLMPISWLSAIPLCSVVFAVGRVLFFKGYENGAASRAFGFALTFYSTVLLAVLMLIQLLIL